MGRTYTPTYRIETRNRSDERWKNYAAWDSRLHGAANDAALERWRRATNVSFTVGGCNWHASEAAGVVLYIAQARIVNQRTGSVVAEAKAPTFEVV